MDGTHSSGLRTVSSWWSVFLSFLAPTVVLVAWLCLSLTLTRWHLTGLILCLTVSLSGIVLHYVAVHFSVNPHRRRFRYAALGIGIRFLSRDSVGGSRPQFFASRENRLSPVLHQLSTSA